ncbi:Uncharacterised protein [Streptococcus agalactiae]|nr:Uncharacterised protein [Streptococcus agalactiae]
MMKIKPRALSYDEIKEKMQEEDKKNKSSYIFKELYKFKHPSNLDKI